MGRRAKTFLPPRDEERCNIELDRDYHKSLLELGERRSLYILRDTAGGLSIREMLAYAYVQGATDAGIAAAQRGREEV